MFNNSGVIDLRELRYFTGLRSIASSQFQNIASAKLIVIPEGVTSIGNAAFGNVSCPSRDFLDLPSTLNTVAYFGYYAPKVFICRAATPPPITNQPYAWANIGSFTVLYVPDTSVDAYKADSKWSKMGSAGTSIVNKIKPLSEYQP